MLKTIRKYLQLLKSIKFDESLSNLSRCDILFFCHDANRGISLEGRAYSPLIDTLGEKFESLGYRCQTIAHPWSVLTNEKGFGDPISINRSYFFYKVINKIIKLVYRSKYDITKSPISKLYADVIKRSCPKVIIAIGSPSELCVAARWQSVFHVELLHGIGYRFIPWGWDKKDSNLLPQGMLSLDNISSQTFSLLKKKGVLIKEIPHPFISKFLSPDQLLPEEWSIKKKGVEYKKEILIALQWGKDSESLDNGLFYKEIEDAIKLSKGEIFWRFRFHPVQLRQRNRYKKSFEYIENFINENKNCEWVESSSLPLPSIARECDGCITMFSMAAYDMAYFGVKTLLLSPVLRNGGVYNEYFDDLVEKGYAVKVQADTKVILDWVSNIVPSSPLISNLTTDPDWSSLERWLRLKK